MDEKELNKEIIDQLIKIIKAVFKAIKEMLKTIVKIWNGVKDFVKELADIKSKIEKQRKLKTKWYPIKDTRLKSQVLNNKPRNLVKRIIK